MKPVNSLGRDWQRGCAVADLIQRKPSHENHEAQISIVARTAARRAPILASAYPDAGADPSLSKGETEMKWETPKACDFRFGFEITMYVAAR